MSSHTDANYEHTGLQNIRDAETGNRIPLDLKHLFVVQPASASVTTEDDATIMRPLRTKYGEENIQFGFDSYALVVECHVEGEGDRAVHVSARFDDNVVDHSQIRQLLMLFGHLATLLSTTTKTSSRLCDLTIAPPEDLEQIMQWNNVRALRPSSDCLHAVVVQWAKSQPDNQAICSWDAELSYRELDSLSSQLAHHLVDNLGLAPEVMVPLYFDKSAWAIVSMLAVLKAGAAYVPLNTAFPIEHNQSIVNAVDAKAVLTSSDHLSLFDNGIVIDRSFIESLPSVGSRQLSSSDPSSAAIVVFTSGTTGKAKGIILTHSSLSSMMREQGPLMGFDTSTRTLHFAAASFDVSNSEVLTTLFHGGCICVPSEYDRLNRLSEVTSEYNVNWLFLTPSLANQLEPEAFPSLRHLALGGEAVTRDHVAQWAPRVRLLNSYGPSEASIWTSMSHLRSDTTTVDIGRGFGCVLWIVDAANHDRLMPIGMIGELVIEGPILAREYLNDAEKTRESFIQDPLWSTAAGHDRRMYKTGDLVRYAADGTGTLLYVGRKDTQVKIRGQRVEVGQVEHHVQSLVPSSLGVAVEMVTSNTTARGRTSRQALAAFVAMEGGDSDKVLSQVTTTFQTNMAKVQTALASLLPPYMIPTVFVPLSKLPLSRSGKVDRVYLRRMIHGLSEEEMAPYRLASAHKRDPATDLESQMQSLWADILGVATESIGLDDNFFMLGGDSISAIKLVSTAQRVGLHFAVADVFSHPKLCELTASLEEARSTRLPEDDAVDLPPFALWSYTNDNLPSALEHLSAQCDVAVEDIEDVYPCTPLQEGLMETSLLQEDTYINRNMFPLDAVTDIAVFQEAWSQLLHHYPILRTRIVPSLGGSNLVQVVTRNHQTGWQYPDSVDEYMSKDKQRPMRYGDALVRYGLVPPQPNGSGDSACWTFVWTLHHSIYDGWTLDILLGSLNQLYNQQKIPKVLPFNRFIRFVSETDASASRKFWDSQIGRGDLPSGFPSLPWTTYQARPNRSMMHTVTIASSATSTSSTANVLRAAWALVIATHTSTEDVIFAMTLSGRNAPLPHIAEMAAPTITTVPMRISLRQNDTVREYLQAIDRQAVEMMPHEHVGLRNIRKSLVGNHQSLELRHLFVVQPNAQKMGRASVLRTNTGTMASVASAGFESYALVIECSLTDQGAQVEAKYDDTVLSEEIVQKLLNRLARFSGILLDPATHQTKLHDLALISAQELDQITAWNNTVLSPVEECVHDVVIRQVVKRPRAPAVCAWDGDLSYSELSDLAIRLSLHLRQLGVGPESLVPIYLDKSLYTVVAMLAVLYAGGASVPLNTAHPLERIRAMIDQVEPTLILTDGLHTEQFKLYNAHVVVLDTALLQSLPRSVGTSASAAISPAATPENSAIVTFTSGSSGTPKGVVLTHSSLSSMIQAQGSRMGFNDTTRTLQFAAASFDVSNSEIFTTLSYGGCVCMPSEFDRLNNISDTVSRFNVNWLFMTPSLASKIEPDTVPSLRHLALGGEAVTDNLIRQWGDKLQLINSYGPSESSIWTSMAVLPGGPVGDLSPANIGKGLGCRLWIVDPTNHNRLSCIGDVGELLIEGPILARGYLRDEEKTRAAFIVNPSWADDKDSEHGRRFYKTGDLVRYCSDGSMVYVGRKDAQVKIRGQRVELAEVEHHVKAVLKRSEDIAVEVLRLRSDEHFERQVLGAFIITTVAETDISTSKNSSGLPVPLPVCEAFQAKMRDVQTALNKRLPSYMVPGLFIPIDRFPMSQSGKLDRKQLRQLMMELDDEQLASYRLSTVTRRAPSTSQEILLLPLWANIVGVEESTVGADDDFFLMGGDSISAMELVSLARSAGISLTVANILQYPKFCDVALTTTTTTTADVEANARGLTLRARVKPFSTLTSNGNDDVVESVRRRILPLVQRTQPLADIVDAYPSTDFQKFSAAFALSSSRWSLVYECLDGTGFIDMERLQHCWTQVVDSQDILRTTFVFLDSDLIQVVLRHIDLGFTVHDIGTDTTTTIEDYTDELRARDMDQRQVTGAPFIRLALIRKLGSDKHRIVFRISHALYDGISLPTMWRHLESLYNGSTAPAPTTVPFSHFISAALADSQREASVQYWRHFLEGSSLTSVTNGSHPVARARTSPSRVSYTRQIVMPIGGNVTFSNVLQGAWSHVLSAVSGHSDIIFWHLVNGRSQATDLVQGPCVNYVPVRVQVDSHSDSNHENTTIMRQLQEQQVARLPYESLGFQDLARTCTDWPTLSNLHTAVAHHNLDIGNNLVLGGTTYLLHSLPDDYDMIDIKVLSNAEPGGHSSRISLSYAEELVTPEYADTLLSALGRAIAGLPLDTIEPPPPPPREENSSISRQEHEVYGEDIDAASLRFVQEAWTDVLGSSTAWSTCDSFVQAGGTLMHAVQLADLLSSQGAYIETDDIITLSTSNAQRKAASRARKGGTSLTAT
ncbi:hypothetical protein ACHAQK_011304 [Fusarium lateritium]